MKSIYLASLISVLASVAPTLAAEGFVPEQILVPVERSIEGRAVDIVGLTTGMTVDAVVRKLAETYPSEDVETEQGVYNIGAQGVTVVTAPFVTTVQVGTVIEPGVQAYFTGPAAGNQLVAIERSVSYHDDPNKPLISTLKAALIEKYGPPSGEQRNGDLVWVYKDGEQIACTESYDPDVQDCPLPGGGYYFDLAKDDDDEAHLDLVIEASIRKSDADPTLVGWMQVAMFDPGLEYEAANVDFNSLVAEWERAQAAAPVVAAPKL